MKVKVNIRDVLARNADHQELLLFHGGVEIDDLLETNGIAAEQDVDVRDLLAQRRAIALVWDADQLLSHYPHLSRDQAWEVLQECERDYKGEEGLCWDDIASAVAEMYPDPDDRLAERVGRFELAVARYNGDWPESDNLVDMLAAARHWCDSRGLDFSEVNGAACGHYLAERDRKGA